MRRSPVRSRLARLLPSPFISLSSSFPLLLLFFSLCIPALPASGQDVTLELGTQNNERVIVKQKQNIIFGEKKSRGEELRVNVTGTTNPMDVTLSQQQKQGGTSVVEFDSGNNSGQTLTVTSSGGQTNRAIVAVKHKENGAFQDDFEIQASIDGQTKDTQPATCVTCEIDPKCTYLADQRPVSSVLQITPEIEGVSFITDVRRADLGFTNTGKNSQLQDGITATTNAEGKATFEFRNNGVDEYRWFELEVAGDREKYEAPSCVGADQRTSGSPGGDECTCECPDCPDTRAQSIDEKDGEKKLSQTDLRIDGRGMDWRLERSYRSHEYREQLRETLPEVREDFGEGWTMTFIDDYLLKDGDLSDRQASYVWMRPDFTATNIFNKSGLRTTKIFMEEQEHFAALNVNDQVGHDTALDKTRTVEVQNGTLNIDMIADESEALLAAIRIEDQNGNVVEAINAGGDAFTAADGTEYSADDHFDANSTTVSTTDAIANTQDDPLYQNQRRGKGSFEGLIEPGDDLFYAIPIADGTYEVTLQFAEIIHEDEGSWTAHRDYYIGIDRDPESGDFIIRHRGTGRCDASLALIT